MTEIRDILQLLNAKPIVIIGMMGSGKTTIGQIIADQTGLAFVDSDEEIEKRVGKTITEIFRQNGEPYFRQIEQEIIMEQLNNGCQIIALGGGGYLNRDLRQQMAQKTVSVWLKADYELLVARLQNSYSRPLLTTSAKQNPEVIIDKLVAERYPLYAQADLTVNITDAEPALNAANVLEAIKNHLSPSIETSKHR